MRTHLLAVACVVVGLPGLPATARGGDEGLDGFTVDVVALGKGEHVLALRCRDWNEYHGELQTETVRVARLDTTDKRFVRSEIVFESDDVRRSPEQLRTRQARWRELAKELEADGFVVKVDPKSVLMRPVPMKMQTSDAVWRADLALVKDGPPANLTLRFVGARPTKDDLSTIGKWMIELDAARPTALGEMHPSDDGGSIFTAAASPSGRTLFIERRSSYGLLSVDYVLISFRRADGGVLSANVLQISGYTGCGPDAG